MLRYLLVLSVLGFGCVIANGEIRAAGENPSQALLSPAKEMELALKAAPAHLRNEATVYIHDLPFVYSGYSGGEKTAYIIVMASDPAHHSMH